MGGRYGWHPPQPMGLVQPQHLAFLATPRRGAGMAVPQMQRAFSHGAQLMGSSALAHAMSAPVPIQSQVQPRWMQGSSGTDDEQVYPHAYQ